MKLNTETQRAQRTERRKKYFFSVSLCLIFVVALSRAVFPAGGEEPPIDAEIVFTATAVPPAEEIADSPITTTIIGQERIQERFTSLPELLNEVAGVEVRNYGGLGSFSTVSIRGSASNHVLVLLDGVPLNQSVGGSVNMSNIPVANIERVEIYRGGLPARFRAASPGGAVNIITKKERGAQAASGRFAVGSFRTMSESLSHAHEGGGERWDLSLIREFSGGRFSYLDDNGTINNAADDRWTDRENNRFRSTNYSFHYTKEIDATRSLSVGEQYFRKGEGVPGLGQLKSRSAHLETARNVFLLAFSDEQIFTPDTRAEFSFSHSFFQTKFLDTASEIGLGAQDNNNKTGAYALNALFESFIGDSHELTAVAEFRGEDYSPHNTLALFQTGRRSARRALSFAVEDRFHLGGEKYLIMPTFRHERLRSSFYEDDPNGLAAATALPRTTDRLTSFALGVKARVSRRIVLKGNAGNYHRAPGFYELFGDRGSTLGNTSLVPEKGTNTDVGLVADFLGGGSARGVAEVTYFNNKVRNLITFTQNSQWTAIASNIGRAEFRGFESSLRLEAGPRWLLTGNFTRQTAKDEGDVPFWRGNSLPGRHERKLNSWVEYRWGKGKAYYQLSVDSANFLDRANLKPVPKRETHNAGLTFFHRDYSVTFEGKNLTGEQISDVAGFPLPGRSYFMTIEWKQ